MRVMPTKLAVTHPNVETLRAVHKLLPPGGRVAEIGIYEGHTTLPLLGLVESRGGHLDIFDYQDVVNSVLAKVPVESRRAISGFGNTTATYDSYNWSFIERMRAGIQYDYVFLDGSHMWHDDALAFFLMDSMLKVGGYMDFDDYDWSISTSRSMMPSVLPSIVEHYSSDQIETDQVPLIIELCVLRSGRYTCVEPRKIYRKDRA